MLLGLVFVNTPTTEAFGHSQEMIKTLSEKLGVDKSKVENAFNAIRSEHHQEVSKRIESKLSQMVKDGKLTENQKMLILAKHKEMEKERVSEMSELKNMSPEQRREHMQKERAELTAWAKENDIDLSLTFGFKHMKMGHRGEMMLKK